MTRAATLTVFAIQLFKIVADTQPDGTKWRSETYGTEWIAFLDDNRIPNYVNLTLTRDEIESLFQQTRRRHGYIGKPTYWLYTRKTMYNPERIVSEDHIKTFIPGAMVFVIIHGWLGNRDSNMVQSIKNAILHEQNNVNVIAFDWYAMQSWIYILDAERTRNVALNLKNFIIRISKIKKYDIKGINVQLVGHSLGAHVAGLAGEEMNKENFSVSRVTGLDPAAPFFESVPLFPGITKKAGAFVDIIHTSIGFLGISNAVGHVDFYPNGGIDQPACCKVKECFPGTCEHSCAFTYYEKSLTMRFKGHKCEDYETFKRGWCNNNEMQHMGYPCSPAARDTFYLNVDSFY